LSSRTTVLQAVLAATCCACGLFLGWHHPVAPALALVSFCGVMFAAARWPWMWLIVVPAGLPWLNFSPWTGWLLFDEFDLLLLAVFAGSYASLALQRPGPAGVEKDPVLHWLLAALLLSGAVGLARGLLGHDGLRLDWYQGYDDPLNSVRVSKSLVWGVGMLPLVRRAIAQDRVRACNSLLSGMGAGLLCVATAALWERLAYPGLTDFSVVYRVTALFWEMHVGGGAIDAYLAMASPFAVLLLVRARGMPMRAMALLLLAGVAYACLTTFSRGVYVAVIVPLAFLALWDLLGRLRRRLRGVGAPDARATDRQFPLVYWALLPVAGLLMWLAAGPDSFLSNRLMNTEKVWAHRWQHWQNSVRLLESPSDWLFGIGAGRFPARYSQDVKRGGFAGVATPVGKAGDTRVTLRGPAPGEQKKGGLFALTQRVDIVPGTRYKLDLDLHPLVPSVLVVQVCERHLLYDWNCQGTALKVAPAHSPWQHYSTVLEGDAFAPTPWFAPRLGMFSLSVVSGGGAVELDNLHLETGDGREMVANGNFASGMARWFPAAQYYFVPWHPDSLYLDWLVERGLTALVSGVGLVLYAVLSCLRRIRAEPWLARCLLASLLGALLVGAVSSFMDVPRVAVLLYLLSYFSIELARSPATVSSRTPRT